MSRQMQLTVLGCGSSSGCPVIACSCSVCIGNHPKNKRTRTAAHIQIDNDISWIIDTGVDFRQQVLREKILHLDAVFYTHAHADHLNGIDDLRAYCFRQKKPLNIYANQFTLENIKERFSYAFLPANRHWNRPVLIGHELKERERLNHVPIQTFELPHGSWKTLAYRIGNIAWLTDISDIDHHTIESLQGLDYLFLDCLMERNIPSHLSVEQAFYFAQQIQAKQTYLIHMTHQLDFDELSKRCPENIAVAYDGLKVISEIDSILCEL